MEGKIAEGPARPWIAAAGRKSLRELSAGRFRLQPATPHHSMLEALAVKGITCAG